MQLVTWSHADKPDERRPGALQGRRIVDLAAHGVTSLEALAADGATGLARLERALGDPAAPAVSLLDARLHAPLPHPPRAFATLPVVAPTGELPGSAQGVAIAIGIVLDPERRPWGYTLLALAGACAMGPALATEAPGGLRLRVNGIPIDLPGTPLDRAIATALAEYSGDEAARPGDILCASMSAHTSLVLRPGDLLECEAPGVGTLRNWCP